jgi:hypothetical protein
MQNRGDFGGKNAAPNFKTGYPDCRSHMHDGRAASVEWDISNEQVKKAKCRAQSAKGRLGDY